MYQLSQTKFIQYILGTNMHHPLDLATRFSKWDTKISEKNLEILKIKLTAKKFRIDNCISY